MRTPLTALLVATALLLSACGGDDKDSSASVTATPVAGTPAPTTAGATTPDDAAADEAGPAAKCKSGVKPKTKSADTPKPTGSLDPSKTYYAVLKTSCGTIRIKLDQQNNPKTANAFATLVKNGFYDGLGFHRVVKDWVVQGGDPAGNGSGGPSWQVVEAPPKDAKYDRGTVAMAKTGTDPDGASGSQFFIVVAADAGLPPQYAIAGKVKTGRKVVDAISNLGADGADGPPSRPVVIEKATLEVQ